MIFKPVKTAVIGAGMISDIYLENLKNRFSIIELVGISDIVEEKAKAQAEKYNIKQMTNEEILNDKEIELVLNLTYASAHYEVNKQIISAGKHCYSEKMMCITMDEADKINELRKKHNVMFASAPDTFLGASQQTARYIIEKGLIGNVIQIIVNRPRGYHMIKSSEDDAKRRYSVMCEGGGIPYDMGGYHLHALFNIFGPVESVCGYATTTKAQRPYLNPRHELFNENFFVNTINTVCASMKFKSGPFCSFNTCSDFRINGNLFELHGTEGTLYLADPNNFGDKIYIEKNEGEKLEFPISHPFKENLRGIGAVDMAWALRCKRKPRISFEIGYHALEVINAIIESSITRKFVELNTDFEIPAPISTEYYSGASEERSLFLY
ncbi:MAG: Gfo/Idh/MocA family oxidoreductase [Ruminococcaceae bacterium]|nr:Gfo/Idh/MocA family oxidoreductase [Oscillospiraceae bacterium]